MTNLDKCTLFMYAGCWGHLMTTSSLIISVTCNSSRTRPSILSRQTLMALMSPPNAIWYSLSASCCRIVPLSVGMSPNLLSRLLTEFLRPLPTLAVFPGWNSPPGLPDCPATHRPRESRFGFTCAPSGCAPCLLLSDIFKCLLVPVAAITPL